MDQTQVSYTNYPKKKNSGQKIQYPKKKSQVNTLPNGSIRVMGFHFFFWPAIYADFKEFWSVIVSKPYNKNVLCVLIVFLT